MKIISSFVISLFCFVILSTNAIAADLVYYPGGGSVGIGYASLDMGIAGIPPLTGVSLQGRSFFSENLALGYAYYFLSGKNTIVNITSMPILIQLEWHSNVSDEFGFFGGIGYSHTTSSIIGMAGGFSTSDSGLTYEGGLEYALTENIIVSLAYRNVALTTGSMGGFHADINLAW